MTPKESGWFESYEITSDVNGEPLPLVSMRDQPLYKEDWIGLKTLDERGAVVRMTCDGPHMHITEECWKPLVLQYVGGLQESARRPLSRLTIQA